MPVSPNFKRISTRIAVTLVVVHFAVTLIYLLPGTWFSYQFNNVTYHYMVPLFHQNWQLFAPEPPKSVDQLLYRTVNEAGDLGEWTDPGALWLEQHQTYRVGAYGKLFNNYEDIGRRLNEDHFRFYNYYAAHDHGEVESMLLATERMWDTESYLHAKQLVLDHLEAAGTRMRVGIPISALELQYQRTWVTVPGTDSIKQETIELPLIDFTFGLGE